tara:strand:- start:1297 stop:2034 length:738 start_codon:yes stop_codon:yes gene_type:complete
MIDRLKTQQNKLLANERHEAWENVARKIAHEIKNPLTPIQLIIDSLKNKYTELLNEENKKSFNDKVKTIDKQVKLIEQLVNEFSDFARMPKPIFKKTNIYKVINETLKLMKINDDSIKISFDCSDKIFMKADSEQLNRVFINLIKNSIESLNEKQQKGTNFDKKIIIEINEINDYIEILIIDNGVGFNTNLSEISKPYFTTKKNGSGLGLSIVEKIINDHNGTIDFLNFKKGAKIRITFPKLNVS